jgi:hypothetical protein
MEIAAGVVESVAAAPATLFCAGRLPALPGGFGETPALQVRMQLDGALLQGFDGVSDAVGDCFPGFCLGNADYVEDGV